MGGYYYTTKAGDAWDYIAYRVYGDEFKMELLLQTEENADLITTVIFADNVKIWCPYVDEEDSDNEEAPWRDSE